MRQGAALAAVCCALALGACGGGGGGGGGHAVAPTPTPVHDPVPMRLFKCRDWTSSGLGLRNLFLAQLRAFYGAPVASDGTPQGNGTVLADDDATTLFDNACKPSYSANFTLYKVYARAAAFAGQAP